MVIPVIALRDVLEYPDLSHKLLLEQIEKKNIQVIYIKEEAYILDDEIYKAIPEDVMPIN
jgi:hypothetical protein